MHSYGCALWGVEGSVCKGVEMYVCIAMGVRWGC